MMPLPVGRARLDAWVGERRPGSQFGTRVPFLYQLKVAMSGALPNSEPSIVNVSSHRGCEIAVSP